VAARWTVYWSPGLRAASGRAALSIAGRLQVRFLAGAVEALIMGGLLAWAFRPLQNVRQGARTWVMTARRRSPRIPLFGSLTASFTGAKFRARSASFDGATFNGTASSFDDVRGASRRGRGRRALLTKSRTTISRAEAAWQH
jgi:hypothetical protein